MPIMEVANVSTVLNRRMAAAFAMPMRMTNVDVTGLGHESNSFLCERSGGCGGSSLACASALKTRSTIC